MGPKNIKRILEKFPEGEIDIVVDKKLTSISHDWMKTINENYDRIHMEIHDLDTYNYEPQTVIMDNHFEFKIPEKRFKLPEITEDELLLL